jgi:hypothetical protein
MFVISTREMGPFGGPTLVRLFPIPVPVATLDSDDE